eukprot:SAG11_NODE_31972_length_287_cov_1.101064_1_plen_25_part_10
MLKLEFVLAIAFDFGDADACSSCWQ